jgi:hypothetical protein
MEEVPCCNFEVCENYVFPDSKCCSTCVFRRIIQKKKDILTFQDDIECPVCFEVKRGVTNINCEHYICIDCFKKCHSLPEEEVLSFPFDDEEYDENHPDIKTWIHSCEKYDKKIYETKNLRLCPICRK